MLKETTQKYWANEHDLNCAECILYAANKEYNLNLPEDALKVMSGFGGGMATGDVCGVVTGAIGVIGVMFTEVSGHKSPKVRAMTREFIKNFKEKMEFIKCVDLNRKYTDRVGRKCSLMVETGAEILEDIINKEIRG